MPVSSVYQISEENFESDVLGAGEPVLVDFSVDWSEPCRNMVPVLDQVAHHFDGRLKVARMNVDMETSVAMRFGIRSVPALLLFQGGELKESLMGEMGKDLLVRKIERHISGV